MDAAALVLLGTAAGERHHLVLTSQRHLSAADQASVAGRAISSSSALRIGV